LYSKKRINMRIAYVAIHLEQTYILGGVGRKIQSQMQVWKSMGHETVLFLHSPDVQDFGESEISAYKKSGNVIKTEIERSKALGKLIENVKAYNPDVIYLRYGLFAFPLQKLFRIAPVFVEVNTDDVTEYRYRGIFFYLFNRITRGEIFKQCTGFVPISEEIAGLPMNRKYKKPYRVIANGIDMDTLIPLDAPGNSTPHLAYVGTVGIPWNGEDKLWDLARKYPDLTIHMIGYNPGDIEVELPRNVILHGRVSVTKVRELLAVADVAIGTMALHRKQLEENSPLKVRESLGYGIPTIIAYLDTDLHGKGFDFLLELPNTENNVSANMDKIYEFAYRMRGLRADQKAIRPLIDQRVKEELRLDFFKDSI
jgi:glycosyltransferase involved in cell wall biosynthesis